MSAILPIGMFLIAALVLFWAYRRGLERDRAVEQRIGLFAPVRPQGGSGAWLRLRSRTIDQQTRRFFAFGAARSWGMKTRAGRLIVVAVVAAALAWILARVTFGLSVLLALPLTAIAAYLAPRALLLREQRAVDNLFSNMFPDAVDTVSRMLRAGLPVSAAVRAIGKEAAAPVDAVFTDIADQMAIGTAIEDALDVSSRRIGLPDFRFFAVAVVLQHATGGNLASTLEILSDIVRRRRAVRLKAKAATAEIRISAYVLGSMPFLMILGLALAQPGYLTPLFTDPRGHVLLMISAVGMLLGGITMRQMMRSVTHM